MRVVAASWQLYILWNQRRTYPHLIMSNKRNLPVVDDLPAGWVQLHDDKTDHPFWVDTKAKPPRASWVHPYDDEQFLNEHPEIRERLAREESEESIGKSSKVAYEPPPYSSRRHSFSESTSSTRRLSDDVRPGTPPVANKSKDRGFLGKMKDAAIGTKEEREESKRREMMAAQRSAGQPQQRGLASQYYDDEYYAAGSSSYNDPRYAPPPMDPGPAPYSRGFYRPPLGDPYAYRPPLGDPYYGRRGFTGRYGLRYGYGRRRGFGGPLLGGLVGGLILGEVLD